MNPESEIDRRVAQEVMGWVQDGNFWVPKCSHLPSADFEASLSWSPSTDITTAWKVVERLRHDGFVIDLHMTRTGAHAQVRHGPDAPEDWATAGDAPLAICLAALAAVSHG